MFGYILTFLIGIVLMFFSLKTLSKKIFVLRHGKPVLARVVDFKLSEDTDTDAILYQAIVKFRNSINKEITYIYPISDKSPDTWQLNEEIKIMYHEPTESIQTLDFNYLFLWTLISLGFGLILVAIGSGFLIFKFLYL